MMNYLPILNLLEATIRDLRKFPANQRRKIGDGIISTLRSFEDVSLSWNNRPAITEKTGRVRDAVNRLCETDIHTPLEDSKHVHEAMIALSLLRRPELLGPTRNDQMRPAPSSRWAQF